MTQITLIKINVFSLFFSEKIYIPKQTGIYLIS